MWLDAFLSTAMVALCLLGCPAVAGLRLPLPTGVSPELITADSPRATDRELTSVQ